MKNKIKEQSKCSVKMKNRGGRKRRSSKRMKAWCVRTFSMAR